jgi:hypothetical protein
MRNGELHSLQNAEVIFFRNSIVTTDDILAAADDLPDFKRTTT